MVYVDVEFEGVSAGSTVDAFEDLLPYLVPYSGDSVLPPGAYSGAWRGAGKPSELWKGSSAFYNNLDMRFRAR